MWRRLLTPLVCLALVHASLFHGAAHAQEAKDPELNSVAEVANGGLDALGSKAMNKILVGEYVGKAVWNPELADDYAATLTKDLKAVKTLGILGDALGLVALGLEIKPGIKRAINAYQSGDWPRMRDEAWGVMRKVIAAGGGMVGGKLAGTAAYLACMATMVGIPFCTGVMVVAHIAGGWGSEKIVEALLEPGDTAVCRSRRTGNGACEATPQIVAGGDGKGPGGTGSGAPGGAAGTTNGAPDVQGGGKAGGPPAPRPPAAPNFAGGGGVSVGSSTLTVTAKNLTAAAPGAGSTASNNVGSVDSGGRASVSAQSVTTTASSGQTATTNLGTGGGDTIVTGNIQNQGGDLTIGSGGTSRDGRKCIDVYRNTCIVHIYYPKHHSDPCAPGYWRVLNACKLPSDDKHSIPGL